MLGAIVDHAQPYGLPVLAMVYDTVPKPRKEKVSRMRHLMRIAVELGVDAIKIAAPEDVADLPEILESIAEDVAVYCAGGTMRSDDALLTLARQAALHGAAGLCIGRNVFQRPSPGTVLDQIRAELAAVAAPAAPANDRPYAAAGFETALQSTGS
jgi:class I fructose-bisphosphate aldolase/fructose-bisphosphate aldolase/2-amino-3,7-dideoxy-D-threo-hept-6-ulosonate synthase